MGKIFSRYNKESFRSKERKKASVKSGKKTGRLNWLYKRWKWVVAIGLVIFVTDVLLFFYVIHPGYSLARKSLVLYNDVKTVQDRMGQDDIAGVREMLPNLEVQLLDIHDDLDSFNYVRILPYTRDLLDDAKIITEIGAQLTQTADDLLEGFEPFAPLVGIGVENVQVDSGEEKIKQLVSIIPQMLPTINNAIDDIEEVLPQIASLHWKRYPNVESFPIKDYMKYVTENSDEVLQLLEDAKIILAAFPDIMGAEDPKTYVVLFQNDNEIRPTGGFMTSYAGVSVDAGVVSISESKNIYEISSEEAYLETPLPIQIYLKQPLWRLRDTNWSPDLVASMETFAYYWERMGHFNYDGVIMADTVFMEMLLEFVGPIEIEGFNLTFEGVWGVPDDCRLGGTEFTHENVVCRLEAYASKFGWDDTVRKAAIGDLMDVMFTKVMESDADQWLPLMELALTGLENKHIQLFFKDDQLQQLAESYNFAGRVVEYDEDYFYLNDANLAGAKSDMYLTRSVNHSYTTENDRIIKTVAITYENTGEYDGWLNGTSRNYLRVYVPEGSTFISVDGGEQTHDQYDEFGKTVFANFVQIPPLSTTTITYKYELPISAKKLNLYVQKQAGKVVEYHSVSVGDKEITSVEVRVDEEIEISLK